MASRHPEIPRARFRVLFFTVLAVACAGTGWWPPAGIAVVGVALGIVSVLVAHARGRSLALTFVVLDWLGMGLLWALSGGAASPLVFAIPLLVTCHLLPTSPMEWPHVIAPCLAGLAVLLIADPTLGDSRPAGLATLTGLLAAGAIVPAVVRRRELTAAGQSRPPLLCRRRPARPDTRRTQRPPAVDPTTDFHGVRRVGDLLTAMLRDAARDHEAVGVVCLRLVHWDDVRDFHGRLAAEAAAAAAARHIRRHLRPMDLAFRVCDDTFLLALKDRTTSQSTSVATELQAALAAHRLERSGERLTAVYGVSSYPAARSLSTLLREAADGVAEWEGADIASAARR